MKPEFPRPLTVTRPRLSLLCSAVLLALAAASARGGSISNVPLFKSLPDAPNTIMGIDDSHSMQAEELMSYGGDFYDSLDLDGGTRRLAFLYPDGNNFISITGQTRNIPPLPQFADARSPVTNRAYFDPSASYTFWTTYGARRFENALPTAARWDPAYPNTGLLAKPALCENGVRPSANFPDQFDLTRDIACVDSPPPIDATKNGGFSFASIATTVVSAGTSYWNGLQMVTAAGDMSLIAIPAGMTYWNGSAWRTADRETLLDPEDFGSIGLKYFPASFYLPHGYPRPYPHYTGAVSTAVSKRTYSPAEIADLRLPVGFTWDGKTWDGYQIKPANFSDSGEYDAAIQNFANWFTYYRKRHSATRGAIGAAFSGISHMSLAVFKSSEAAVVSPTPLNMTDLSDRNQADALIDAVYNMHFTSDTATPQAVDFMGEQYRRVAPSPIIRKACQRNYGILFTDGVPDTDLPAAITQKVGNFDGRNDGLGNQIFGPPYSDQVGTTMADIAMYYYANNLNPSDLPDGQVPRPTACDNPNHDPWLDCNSNLHMNFYAVSLGLKGNPGGFDPVSSTRRSAYNSPMPTWPSVYPGSPLDMQDDLWHATINGRGELLSATRPAEVREKLIDILSAIVGGIGSGAALATSSAFADDNTLIFQSVFDPANWSGDLLAYRFEDGVLAPDPVWKASEKLPPVSQRHIYSSVPVGTYCGVSVVPDGYISAGIDFQWANLNCEQKRFLNNNDADTLGEDRLKYISGDTSREEHRGGPFRDRIDFFGHENLLGDFVHSVPAYSAASITEDFGYSLLPESATERGSYSEFVLRKKNRTPMIYIGGNDGMLHAFNASHDANSGGKEVFAYVPLGVYKRLPKLTGPEYLEADTGSGNPHQFTVDGSPWIGDAYLNGIWGTYLIGTSGAGARSVFAIDITNPDPESGSSEKKFDKRKILWDLSGVGEGAGATYPDLGYTLARPAIVRTNSSDDRWKWVVIVGNGYESPNGRAEFFIISLANANDRIVLDTKVGTGDTKNGLSTAIAVDVDHNRTADLAYAGDLFGNVWKFDLRSSNASEWKIAYGTELEPKPLFTACADHAAACVDPDQHRPITSKPQVAEVQSERGGLMVFVGTGTYFEHDDTDAAEKARVQSVYGLWDKNTLTNDDLIGGNTLVRQTIDAEVPVADGLTVRVTSDHPVDFATRKGWYLDLKREGGVAEGERVTTDPVYREGKILFASFTPSSGQECATGGKGWLTELNAETGSRPSNINPIFDLGETNSAGTGTVPGSDGHFDQHDLVSSGGGQVAPSGIATSGIPYTPIMIQMPNPPVGGSGSAVTRCAGSSTAGSSCVIGPPPPDLGRQSWQQLQ